MKNDDWRTKPYKKSYFTFACYVVYIIHIYVNIYCIFKRKRRLYIFEWNRYQTRLVFVIYFGFGFCFVLFWFLLTSSFLSFLFSHFILCKIMVKIKYAVYVKQTWYSFVKFVSRGLHNNINFLLILFWDMFYVNIMFACDLVGFAVEVIYDSY